MTILRSAFRGDVAGWELLSSGFWRCLWWWASAVFRNAGHWLVREDPLGKADVIVVLSGGLPFRAEGAADVFKSGYAPAVWISRAAGPQEELAALGIHFVGEEEYNREILVKRGRAGFGDTDFSGGHR